MGLRSFPLQIPHFGIYEVAAPFNQFGRTGLRSALLWALPERAGDPSARECEPLIMEDVAMYGYLLFLFVCTVIYFYIEHANKIREVWLEEKQRLSPRTRAWLFGFIVSSGTVIFFLPLWVWNWWSGLP